jgi:hypothetical protein
MVSILQDFQIVPSSGKERWEIGAIISLLPWLNVSGRSWKKSWMDLV